MITISSNTATVIAAISEKVGQGLNAQLLTQKMASAVLPVLKKRVHEDGLDSKGSRIGTYSPGYMKVRTGNYGNSGKYVKGKKAGQQKDAGVFIRGAHKGSPRPKYNRTNETKVIGSLTRQMENDTKVIPTKDGHGIGYSNEENYKKALWLDETYKKRILTQLTEEELKLAVSVATEQVNEILKTL